VVKTGRMPLSRLLFIGFVGRLCGRADVSCPLSALRSITEARQMLNRYAHLRRYRVCPRRGCGYARV